MDCTYWFIVTKPVAKAGQVRLSVRNGQSKTVNCATVDWVWVLLMVVRFGSFFFALPSK